MLRILILFSWLLAAQFQEQLPIERVDLSAIDQRLRQRWVVLFHQKEGRRIDDESYHEILANQVEVHHASKGYRI